MTRRRDALAKQAETVAPVPPFDPADFALQPSDGWDAWTLTVAAVLHVRRHGLAVGPPYPVAKSVAATWLRTD